jgi:hypothetical protein
VMIVIVVSLFLCFDFKAFNYVFNFPFLYAVVFYYSLSVFFFLLVFLRNEIFVFSNNTLPHDASAFESLKS